LLSIVAGVLVATLSGSNVASTAILGSALAPEMEKRGYNKAMTLGPIMAAGSLAMLIPPSSLAVFIAAMAETSIGAVLIGGAVPGIMLAIVTFSLLVILTAVLHPVILNPYPLTDLKVSRQIAGNYFPVCNTIEREP